MCFKTAKLAAPASNQPTTGHVASVGASYTVTATGTREVKIGLGRDPAGSTQFFTPDGLREFATQLNELADKLDA